MISPSESQPNSGWVATTYSRALVDPVPINFTFLEGISPVINAIEVRSCGLLCPNLRVYECHVCRDEDGLRPPYLKMYTYMKCYRCDEWFEVEPGHENHERGTCQRFCVSCWTATTPNLGYSSADSPANESESCTNTHLYNWDTDSCSPDGQTRVTRKLTDVISGKTNRSSEETADVNGISGFCTRCVLTVRADYLGRSRVAYEAPPQQ